MTIQQVESLARKYKAGLSIKPGQPDRNLPSAKNLKLALSSTSIVDVQRLEGVSGELENVWSEGQKLVSAHISWLQNMVENRRRSEQGTRSGVRRPRRT